MKNFRLLGKPVTQSLSPLLYSVAFSELQIEADYEAVEVDADSFPDLFLETARLGGGNVTIPHKLAAAKVVDHASADVRATGACNCFWQADDGSIVGDNTDVEGFRRATEEMMPGMFLQGADVLLIGAGGAAAAVIQSCVLSGASCVHLVNRSSERARSLAKRFA